MQVTISSEEPLETVLGVISAMYGVEVTWTEEDEGGENQRTVKVRHTAV